MTGSRAAAALLVAVALLLASPWGGEAFASDRRIDVSRPQVHRIFLPVSRSVTVELNAAFGDIVVADAGIADSQPMTDRVLYIVGKAPGTTSVLLFSAERRSLGVIEVEVGVDMDDMTRAIRHVAPSSRVTVASVNGRVRLGGRVKDGATLAAILDVARQYGADAIINSIEVEDSQQVNLEVRVLEVSRNAGRELGVSLDVGRDGSQRGLFATAAGAAALFPSGNAPLAAMVARVIDAGVNVDVMIRMLEDKRLARRLAEPNLTTLSGEEASFLAGGEVPIPVARKEEDVTIQFKEYGVRLRFTPIVLENDKINLRLEPEVSEVDPTVTVRTADVEIPAFITRRVSTVVELRDGQSFAVAGLLQAGNRRVQSQIPWVGQLPVIGALFRSSSFIRNETELVVIVTPRLVRPAAPGQQIATPLDASRPSNDPEFFLLGQLEVTRDMVRAYERGHGVIGPYGHMLDVRSRDGMVYVKK